MENMEKEMIRIVNKYSLPFNYVGDGQVMIGGFNPDFLSKNPKHIIEVDGDYWHSLANIQEKDKRKMKTFSSYGYKTLVIKESELVGKNKLSEQQILSKINLFLGG